MLSCENQLMPIPMFELGTQKRLAFLATSGLLVKIMFHDDKATSGTDTCFAQRAM